MITPRTRKPVEIQVLWLNALGFAVVENALQAAGNDRWLRLQQQGLASFHVGLSQPVARTAPQGAALCWLGVFTPAAGTVRR